MTPFHREGLTALTAQLLEQVDLDLDDGALGPFSPGAQADATARLGSFVIHLGAALGEGPLPAPLADAVALSLDAAYPAALRRPKDPLLPVLEDAAAALSCSIDTLHVLCLTEDSTPTP